MDPFTQLLLERTKASRNKLEAKLSNTPQPLPRKRRSPLKENDIMSEIAIQTFNQDVDDSPEKRQCIESIEDKIDGMKENKSQETRKISVGRGQQDRTDYKLSPLGENNGIKHKRTNRLANLAAQINSWEDDIKDTATLPRSTTNAESTSPVFGHDDSSISRSCLTTQLKVSSSIQKSRPERSQVSSLTVSQKPKVSVTVLSNDNAMPEIEENARSSSIIAPKAAPRRRSSSFSGLSSSQPARQSLSKKQSFSAEKNTTTKTILWDQAVVATLEAQGFVQSPSRSKLQYNFRSAPVTPRKKLYDDTESSDDSDDAYSISPSSVPSKKSPKMIVDQGRISVKQLAEKFATPFVAAPKGKDPAELPLSARVALFEKEAQLQQSCSTASAVVQPKGPPNTKNIVAKVSPKKVLSKSAASPSEENNTRHSPTKPVGAHTFELHRKLFEHGQNWKENDISLKLKEDREKDMEVVLNRWTFKSKQAAETAARSVTSQRIATQSQKTVIEPKITPQKSVSKPVVVKTPPVPPPLPPAPIVSFDSKPSYNPSDNKRFLEDESLSETESDDDALQYLETPLDSEEEINRALAVVDAICTDEDGETDMDSSILKEAFEKIEKVQDIYNDKEKSSASVLSNVTFKVPASRAYAAEKEEPKSDEDQPLLHTISFYRKQKEMSRHTVLRNVVRNEISSTSDSVSDTDDESGSSQEQQQQSVQDKIKHLQDEVVTQQAVMRQASQALVLCRSNELFQGSLEQIEGERLLLVAAQKRQACLSDIERLKTDGALGTPNFSKIMKGSLSVGDMKLVLKREFLEQTANGKSGDFVHFFICLIKHRAQVIATQMTSTMDSISAGALHFPNLINIRDLDRDFNVIIEVYGLQTKRDCINREHKMLANKKDKSKLTLTPKKRQSKKDLKLKSPKIQSPGGPNVICTSSFALIGYTALNIKTLNKKNWNLEKVPYVSPLEGSLIMKVRCFSDFSNEEQGFLTMFDDVGGFGAWHRRWFVLSDRVLSYWKYPDDVKQKSPIGQIDLCQCITSDVCLVPRDICARPHTFMLLIVRPPLKENADSLIVHNFKSYATIKVLLSADTKEERISWCQQMNKTLENLRTWDSNALRPIPDDFQLHD